MPRIITRGLQVAVDLAVLSVAFWLAFLFRFEFSVPAAYLRAALVAWPFAVGLEYGVLWWLGVTRYSWRYVSMRETVRIAGAVSVATVALVAVRLIFGARMLGGPLWLVLPLGVLGSNAVLALVGLVGIRASRRLVGEAVERRSRGNGQRATVPVLLIGAGQAGVMVARELAYRPELALRPIGFVDDDPHKQGLHIAGVPVLGTTAALAKVALAKGAKRALITIANASGADIRRIAMMSREAGLATQIIPGIYEIVGERVNLSRIREVAIEDLLGRAPVSLDDDLILASCERQTVMVTGAGGSIGSELCRQICRFAPRKLILVERFENALFEIHRELTQAHPTLAIEPRIADVTDATRMEAIFAAERPDMVLHAAAHKHVPMMEANPGEAIKNNVGGTRLVADLAHRFGAARFVMISTDKAVNPTSVMGATKRVAEIYAQALAQTSQTRYITVRFGNVLGSNGSVIPIFKQQIAQGGPVTVTHPEMQRYFMTIPEASQLVLQAGAMGQGSEIFILDMGEPVKIVDLARDLISLSGFRPGEDIEIRFSGMRPGEKLFEELSTDTEHADKTKHPKVFIGHIAPPDRQVVAAISHLQALADTADADTLRSALAQIVPEYTGASGVRALEVEEHAAHSSNAMAAATIH